VLHTRAVETQGESTQVVEFWQAADHPGAARTRVTGSGPAFETAGDQLYDPSTDVIYDVPGGDKDGKSPVPIGGSALGDPMVTKVRMLLQRGDMVVSGPEDHGGTRAYVIALKPDVGRPVWRLWVSAADGRPLELSDPGRDANEAPQEIRWPVYEVVPAADASSSLSLPAAHPDARVVDDADAAGAAMQRIFGDAKAAAADHGRKPS
jgi:hypothetical protein